MSVRNDKVNVSVYLDGKQALNSLGKLELESEDLRRALKGMKKDTEEYVATSKKLDKVNADMAHLRKEIGVTGMTVQQLTKYQRDLNKELNNITPGTQKYQELTSKIKEANTTLQNHRNSVKGVNSEVKGMSNMMASFTGNLLADGINMAVTKVVEFGRESLNAYRESKAANAQIDAALESTAGAAGLTKSAIDELASSMQKKYNIDDDVIKQNASVLLTFTNIKKGVFEEALPAITDLSTRMGGDMQAATVQVGKALNDPIKGITALTKVGVSFTDQQKEQIKTLVESGRTADAQKMILAELNTEFGGSAAAAADAQGAVGKYDIAVGELQETLGGLMDEGFSPLTEIGTTSVEVLTDLLNEAEPVKEVFSDLWVTIKETASSFWSAVEAILPFNTEGNKAGVFMKVLGTILQTVIAPFRGLATVIQFVSDGFSALINTGKKVMNFFGAEFKIDPDASFTKAYDNMTKNLSNIKDGYVKIWTDSEKEIVASNTAVKNTVVDNERQLTDEQLKEIERRKKQREKEYNDLLKGWESLQADIAKISREQELAAMTPIDRELAQIDDKYAALFEKIKENEARRLELGIITETEYESALEEARVLREAEKAVVQQKFEEEKNKKDAEKEANKLKTQAEIDEALFLQTADSNAKRTHDINKFYDDLVLKAKEAGIDTVEIENRRQKALSTSYRTEMINKMTAEEGKAMAVKEFANLAQATAQLVADMSEDGSAYSKAIALTGIAINTAAALGNVIAGATAAAGATGPAAPFVLAGYIASGVATVVAAFSQASKVLSQAKTPPKPTFTNTVSDAPANSEQPAQAPAPRRAFALGGYTGIGSVALGGVVNKPSFATFGELGPEYVVPNWMMQQPAIANIVGMMEAVRVQRYASGGVTTPSPSAAIQNNISVPGMDVMVTLLQGIYEEVSKTKKAYVSLTDINDAEQTLTEIENEANT